ncbi:MAG: UDP-N-acetylmuramate--L-alanine ligase [Defluviitaleaceae bacterium]|nr:UDP-N-acetylmuramate--L-alanine ligase [Defluviitaleaceae bacterium]
MRYKNVHFIGIGGSSMNGLAKILKQNGCRVSGSDNKASEITKHLQEMGIEVYIPNTGENIRSEHDLIVYTAAIRPDNPEFAAARERGIPMMERSVLLGEITRGYERTICVAGSHGKTTTTALLAGVTVNAGLDPTVHIGANVNSGINNRIGTTPYFILEACEYRDTFLQLTPYIGVILNVDADHMDFYGGMDGLIHSFAQFARRIRPEGVLLINRATQGYEKIIEGLPCRVVTFGEDADACRRNLHYFPENVVFDDNGRPIFDVMRNGEGVTRVALPLIGQCNMMNALACYAVSEQMGIEPDVIKRGLEAAKGVKRRFEYKGSFNGVDIIDDYAHHPTEVRACLAAARKRHKGRIVCIFQPHLYSRTRDLMEDFAQAFEESDMVLLLPIFAAREPFDPTVSSAMLGKRMSDYKDDVQCFEDFYTAEMYLRKKLIPNDLLITMGAGDVYLIGEHLL